MTTATKSPPNLAERAAEAEAKLSALRARRASLALDAFNDAKAKKALATVEDELADAESEIERIELAGTETERREAVAIEAAKEAARAGALAEARKLQKLREAAAVKVDESIETFCGAVSEWANVCNAQASQLNTAGKAQWAELAQPAGWPVEGALVRGLRKAGVRALLLDRIGFTPTHIERPLAERDVVPIEPEAGDE